MSAEPIAITTGISSTFIEYYYGDSDNYGQYVACGRYQEQYGDQFGTMAMWSYPDNVQWYKYYELATGGTFYFSQCSMAPTNNDIIGAGYSYFSQAILIRINKNDGSINSVNIIGNTSSSYIYSSFGIIDNNFNVFYAFQHRETQSPVIQNVYFDFREVNSLSMYRTRCNPTCHSAYFTDFHQIQQKELRSLQWNPKSQSEYAFMLLKQVDGNDLESVLIWEPMQNRFHHLYQPIVNNQPLSTQIYIPAIASPFRTGYSTTILLGTAVNTLNGINFIFYHEFYNSYPYYGVYNEKKWVLPAGFYGEANNLQYFDGPFRAIAWIQNQGDLHGFIYYKMLLDGQTGVAGLTKYEFASSYQTTAQYYFLLFQDPSLYYVLGSVQSFNGINYYSGSEWAGMILLNPETMRTCVSIQNSWFEITEDTTGQYSWIDSITDPTVIKADYEIGQNKYIAGSFYNSAPFNRYPQQNTCLFDSSGDYQMVYPSNTYSEIEYRINDPEIIYTFYEFSVNNYNGNQCPSFQQQPIYDYTPHVPFLTEYSFNSSAQIYTSDINQIGDYSITVYTYYENINAYSFYNVLIKIRQQNRNPKFVSDPVNYTLPIDDITIFNFPVRQDDDGDFVYVNSFYQLQTGNIPTFITFDWTNNVKVQPTNINLHCGNFTMEVAICDGRVNVPYRFWIYVNCPPSFTSSLVDQSVSLNQQKDYYLPSTADPDSDNVQILVKEVSLGTLPNFIVFTPSPTPKFTLQPTVSAEIGTHKIEVTLSDGIQITDPVFFFNVVVSTVSNLPPYFTASLIAQTAITGHTKSYTLPTMQDPEGAAVTMSAVESGKTALPSFVSLIRGSFNLIPTPSDIGTFFIDITLSDGTNSPIIPFQIQVIANSVPTFKAALQDQVAIVGVSKAYSLPATEDLDLDPVSITAKETGQSTLPTFVSFTGSTFTFFTNLQSDTGSKTIRVTLNDGITSNIYSFKLTIAPNQPPTFASALANQQILCGSTSTYTLPAATDPENLPFTIKATENQLIQLPSFVSFTSNVFTMTPSSPHNGLTYKIAVTLDDTFNQNVYLFDVIVKFNNPPSFDSSLVSQSVVVGFSTTYNLPTFTDPENDVVTVSAMEQGQSTIPVFVSLSGSSFSIAPNVASQVGTYTIAVILDDAISTTVSTFSIKVNTNQLPTFSGSLSNQSVQITLTLTYTLPSYSDPEGNTVTLSAVQNGMAALPSFCSLSGSTFTCSPTQLSQKASYSIDVSLNDGFNTNIYNFNIAVLDPPNQPPKFTAALQNQVVISCIPKTYALPPATDPENDLLTISAVLQGQTSLPSFVTLIGANFNLNPTNVDIAASPFLIDVTLYDGHNPVLYTYSITVNVNNPPSFTASLTSIAIQVGSVQNYNLPTFTDPENQAVSLTAFEHGVAQLPPFITLTGMVFTIEPTIASQVGSYTIDVALNDIANNVVSSFNVNISPPPNLPPSFESSLKDQTITAGRTATYTLPAITDPENNPITIKATQAGQVTLPSFASLSGQKFTFTPLVSDIGANPNIIVILNDGTNQVASSFFVLVVVSTNQPPSLASTPVDQTVEVSYKKMYTLPAATDPDSSPGPLTLTTFVHGTSSLPSFVSFIGSTYIFQPTSATDVGTYQIDVVLTDTDVTVIYSFNLIVTPYSNNPPILSTGTLVDQIVEINQTVSYTIPSYNDPNGDSITLTTYKFMSTMLPNFMTFSSGKYVIAPKIVSQVGTYQIKLELSDGHDTSTYQFNVVVVLPAPPDPPPATPPTPPPSTPSPPTSTPATPTPSPTTPPPAPPPPQTPTSPSDIPPEQLADGPPPDNATDVVDAPTSNLADSGSQTSTSSQESESTSASGSGISVASLTKKTSKKSLSYIDKRSGLVVKIVTGKVPPKIELAAKIASINMKGLCTVRFSDEMIIPKNYTLFNDGFLKFTVYPGEELQPGQNKSIKAWQIVDFRSNEMDIQLNFTDPIIISQSLKKDKLEIKFMANGYFVRKSDNSAIKYKYPIEGYIPPQLVVTSAILKMEQMGAFASSSMNYILYGNIGLQIFMSVSMQLLWGMVNTLQLIIHMNMLSVLMPANVQLFFTLIVDIVNFKIIKTDTIINALFGLKEEFKSKASPEFQQTGYGSTNLLRNLGLLLLAILALVGLIAFVFLLRALSKRFAIINKIQLFLSQKLFFNSICRSMLETYLKFSISTWIAMQNLQIDDREGIINTWVTIGFSAIILGFPVFIFTFLKKNSHRLEEEDFKKRFESLYLNVDTSVNRATLTVTLFVFRRLVYAANIVFFNGSTVSQLFTQFFCCLLMLLFFTDVLPLQQPLLNRIEIFNELTLLICSYFMFLFTDFVDDPNTRFMLGWGFIGLSCFNIIVNWCALFYKVYSALRLIIRKAYYNWRVKRMIAKKEQTPSNDIEKMNIPSQNPDTGNDPYQQVNTQTSAFDGPSGSPQSRSRLDTMLIQEQFGQTQTPVPEVLGETQNFPGGQTLKLNFHRMDQVDDQLPTQENETTKSKKKHKSKKGKKGQSTIIEVPKIQYGLSFRPPEQVTKQMQEVIDLYRDITPNEKNALKKNNNPSAQNTDALSGKLEQILSQNPLYKKQFNASYLQRKI